MAVNRQVNFLGQQRVDVPHIRSLESAVCYDFDAVGLMVTGGVPCVVKGFDVVNYSSIVDTSAQEIVVNTADSRIIHPLASDSGSFFQVPADRAPETLNTHNTRVKGSWSIGTVNYVGIDLLRTRDESTATTVRFLTTNPDAEVSKYVPLARTMDYVITISTSPFSVTPSICPFLIVTIGVDGKIDEVRDARNLLFSNFSGGDSPSLNNPFGWPGGRSAPTLNAALTAGDKSIKSLRQWMQASMTRFQEIGGGEYWYSVTADRNVRLAQTGTVFSSSGECFEWTGSPLNLHWKGLKFVFDNSTSFVNEIADQLTDSAGLTNLADGECIYVDLDRTYAHKVSTNDALVAQKAVLNTLGSSGVPGQRWVVAWRIGDQIFVRDQSAPLGTGFRLATIAITGVIRTTINANGDIAEPIAVGLACSAGGFYTATCGGISHNTDRGTTLIDAGGDIVIGRGHSAGDFGVYIQADFESCPVVIYGKTDYSVSAKPALQVIQGDTDSADVIASFCVGSSTLPSAGGTATPITTINADCSISMAASAYPISKPAAIYTGYTPQKVFFRKDKTYIGQVQAVFYNPYGALFDGWSETPTGTWTRTATGALESAYLNGVTPLDGLNLLVWQYSIEDADRKAGFYTLTSIGGSGTHAVITRQTNRPLFHGSTCYNLATTGDFSSMFISLNTADYITADTTALAFFPTTSDYRIEYCTMWPDGTVTPISQSPTLFMTP